MWRRTVFRKRQALLALKAPRSETVEGIEITWPPGESRCRGSCQLWSLRDAACLFPSNLRMRAFQGRCRFTDFALMCRVCSGETHKPFSFDAVGAGGRGWQFIEPPPRSLIPTALYKVFDDLWVQTKILDKNSIGKVHMRSVPPGWILSFFSFLKCFISYQGFQRHGGYILLSPGPALPCLVN